MLNGDGSGSEEHKRETTDFSPVEEAEKDGDE